MLCLCLLTPLVTLAQQETFTGTWKLVDFKMVMEEDTNHRDAAALKAEGAVWDLIFREDGSLTQTSNYA